MNMFMEILHSYYEEQNLIYDAVEISDTIHAAPFIEDEPTFKKTQDYIINIYQHLIAAHFPEARMIGFGLAERVINAGSRNNYLTIDKPHVKLEAREAKAYRLLQRVLLIDSTIVQASDDSGVNLLQMAVNHGMDSIAELLLRHIQNKNQFGTLAYSSAMHAASPKLMAKFLTDENIVEVDAQISADVFKSATFLQLHQFMRIKEQFRNKPEVMVVGASRIVLRCVVEYAKCFYPYYKELRDYYVWREAVLGLRFGKFKLTDNDTEQTQGSKPADVRPVLCIEGTRNLIVNFCRPSYTRYQALADAGYNRLLVPNQLDMFLTIATDNQHQQPIAEADISELAQTFFEEQVLLKKMQPSPKP